MTGCRSLAAQTAALEAQLAEVHGALEARPGDGLAQYDVTARSLEERVRRCAEDVTAFRGDQEPTAAAWDRLSEIRSQCEALFREVLAFVQGAWARQEGLDAGLCELADHLLHDLDSKADADTYWGRVTSMGSAEFVRQDSAIIRVRYPAISVWDLPILAHEYGHFVCPRIRRSDRDRLTVNLAQPVQEHLRAIADQRDRLREEELLADTFATFVMGPSYAATMLLLRFNPRDSESNTHPSAMARADLVLATLDRMDETRNNAVRFHKLTKLLRDEWSALAAAAGTKSDLETVTHGTKRVLEFLFPVLDQYVGSRRYVSYGRAEALSFDPTKQDGATTLADVMNAAWLRRIRKGEDQAGSIGRWALDRGRLLARGGRVA